MRTSLILVFVLTTCFAFAQGQKSYFYHNQDGAIKGYDPVAYFLDNKPVKGSEDITYEWKNAVWHFKSVENLELFRANPTKYAPQYGGYCAYAVAKGYTAKVDPLAWKIIDGNLYLNYNESVQKNWVEDLNKYIERAEENWPAIVGMSDL